MSGLTSTGWVPKTSAELLVELEAALRAELGEDVDVSAESVFGPVLAVCALKLGELWELTGSIYAARTPTGAGGESLDALAGICPAIERRDPTKGTVTLSVTLAPTVTLPAGSIAHVAGEPTNAWVTVEAVSNGGGVEGPFNVLAEALVAGVVRANSSSITVIATPVSGWVSVTNAADATPGEGIEGDAALRLRREVMLQRAASSPLDAIVAQVADAEIPGVTQVVGWENTSLHTDSAGRPGKSVEVLVLGGPNEAIARAIWAAKAGGIETYGGVTVTFADDRGQSRTVKFSRPTDLLLYATIDLTTDSATYAGAEAVKTAFLDAAERLRAGETVRISDLVTAVCAVAGVIDAYVWVGFVSTQSYQRRENLPVGPRDRAVFDSSRIALGALP